MMVVELVPLTAGLSLWIHVTLSITTMVMMSMTSGLLFSLKKDIIRRCFISGSSLTVHLLEINSLSFLESCKPEEYENSE